MATTAVPAINLPSVPRGWNELTWEQLTGVWNLLLAYPRGIEDAESYIRIYQFLAGVRFRIPSVDELPEGCEPGVTCVIERVGKSPETYFVDIRELQILLMGWHVEVEGVKEDREGLLEWVDKRQGLTRLPKEFIKIGRRKYFLPSPMMTSLTYQQYGNMQKILQAFWQTEQMLLQHFKQAESKQSDLESGFFSQSEKARLSKEIEAVYDRIKEGVKQQKDLRNRFLAHTLNGRRFRLTSHVNGGTNLSVGWVYAYNVEDAEAQTKYMDKVPDVVFRILLQWFQSCMAYYKEQMPDLFSNEGGMDMRSPLMSEIDTVNSIMKWKGAYTTQQEVYDTNAIFIFGDLKDMTREAKEIEKAQSKVRRRK